MTVEPARPEKFPCPCCGYRVFESGPGSQSICPVCFWEDDEMQLRWPLLEGCSNKVSLVEAQANYQLLGASEERFLTRVRSAEECECRSPCWRVIDMSRDVFEATLESRRPWPEDRAVLYWWTPGFWNLHPRLG